MGHHAQMHVSARVRQLLTLMALIALTAAVAGCGSDGGDAGSSARSDPPTSVATVYFADVDGALVAEERRVPADDVVGGAVAALAEGPRDARLLPALPEGTLVLGVRVDGDVVRVDLGGEFESGYPAGGAAAELAVVAPLVHTAARAAGVDAVVVTVDGRVPAPVGSQIDFSQPLTPRDLPG